MTVTPKSGFGTLLKILATGTYHTIEGVRNLTGPECSLETIDATHHSSASGYRQLVASFKDGGEVNFDLLYDSTDTYHQQLFTDYEAKTCQGFKIEFTDAGAEKHGFTAFITNMAMAAPIDDCLTMAVTLKISGGVTRS